MAPGDTFLDGLGQQRNGASVGAAIAYRLPSSFQEGPHEATAATEDPPRALRGGEAERMVICTPSARKKAATAKISPRG